MIRIGTSGERRRRGEEGDVGLGLAGASTTPW
jgi:hypothetical protein